MRKQILLGSIAVTILAGVAMLVAAVGTLRTARQPTSPVKAAPVQESPPPYGSISGQVVDPDGKPVAGATVSAFGVRYHMGKEPYAESDEQGRFLIERVRPELYSVSASKEEDGYPDASHQLYSFGSVQPPQVNVYPQQTTPDVVVQLLPKCPRLEISLVDSKTRRKVWKGASVTIRRVDNPRAYLTAGVGDEETSAFLAPNAPFTIEVTAPGYKKWRYKGTDFSGQAEVLSLKPSEKKRITVSLEREE